MSRFALTLPSNSSADYYPNNTVAKYVTKLPEKIELDGEWEVGLAEISFPSAVENVISDRCYYNLYINESVTRKIVLPPGNHKRVYTLIDVLHKEQLDQTGMRRVLVEFNDDGGRIFMQIYNNAAIQFSPDLARLLGLDEDVTYSQKLTAPLAPSLKIANIHSVYVYCDILEHVAVGDTRAPLLRIIDKPGKLRGNVHQTLNPILHIPVQKKNFDTVEINIMTDTGVPVPFLGGKSFVVLEFRRVVHPLFGI